LSGSQVKTVAVQGAVGCFSQQAAAQFAPGAAIVYCRVMEHAFAAVLEGRAHALVLPVRNTLAGEIPEHLRLAAEHPQLAAVADCRVQIRMCLLAPANATLRKVTHVYSHAVALRQCSRFFAAHPHMVAQPYHDTAGALEYVMQLGDATKAALASAEAGRYYLAQMLARDVQDSEQNFTEFHLLQG